MQVSVYRITENCAIFKTDNMNCAGNISCSTMQSVKTHKAAISDVESYFFGGAPGCCNSKGCDMNSETRTSKATCAFSTVECKNWTFLLWDTKQTVHTQ